VKRNAPFWYIDRTLGVLSVPARDRSISNLNVRENDNLRENENGPARRDPDGAVEEAA